MTKELQVIWPLYSCVDFHSFRGFITWCVDIFISVFSSFSAHSLRNSYIKIHFHFNFRTSHTNIFIFLMCRKLQKISIFSGKSLKIGVIQAFCPILWHIYELIIFKNEATYTQIIFLGQAAQLIAQQFLFKRAKLGCTLILFSFHLSAQQPYLFLFYLFLFQNAVENKLTKNCKKLAFFWKNQRK